MHSPAHWKAHRNMGSVVRERCTESDVPRLHKKWLFLLWMQNIHCVALVHFILGSAFE